MKTKKQLEEEIRKFGNEIIDLINEYSLRKPYHEIDLWEMQNVAEATLTQTNEIIKLIENSQRWNEVQLKKGVGMKKDSKGYFINYYELLQEIRGDGK